MTPGAPMPMPRKETGRRCAGRRRAEHELDRGVAVAPFEGQVDRAQDLASQVHDGTAEARLAEVEPDEVAAVRGHAQEDRRLAAARLAATDFLDQAVVHERADEVADGGARQAGDPCKVGARERAAIVQGAQDELLVEGSRLLVRRLLRQHRRAGAHPRVTPQAAATVPDAGRQDTGQSGAMVCRGHGFVKSVDNVGAGVRVTAPSTSVTGGHRRWSTANGDTHGRRNRAAARWLTDGLSPSCGHQIPPQGIHGDTEMTRYERKLYFERLMALRDAYRAETRSRPA